MNSLKSIIDRAEMDLKSKAEAVLSSSFSDNFTGQVFVVCNGFTRLFFDTLVQFYQPFVASSQFSRVAPRLRQAAGVHARWVILLLLTLLQAFDKQI